MTIHAASAYHVPVLLQSSVDALCIKPSGIYFDLTFGGGGHSREILRRLGPDGKLFAFDQDADAFQNVPHDDQRLVFVHSNFRHLARWARYYGVAEADGVLADLGVSSHHFDDATRGFSFRFDSVLDMRMNKGGEKTAADVLNTYSEEQLSRIFSLYGELPRARQMARAVVKARDVKPLHFVSDLTSLFVPLLPRSREKKEMAKLFQALRIEVNKEMSVLAEMLSATAKSLRVGGRLVVLTYHSLEDRMVKNVMRSGSIDGRVEQDLYGHNLAPLRMIGNKPIVPNEEEQLANPRSRSAKLRVAERIASI